MNQVKIVFLQTAHAADDDRVWYHQADALLERNHNVHIVASHTNFITNEHITLTPANNNATLSERIKLYAATLGNLNPDIVICDTPIAVNCAKKLKKHKKLKIIYDVTEWYPSKKNLRGLNPVKKILKALALSLASIIAGFSSDGLIFGEYHKAKPFRILFPFKPFVNLPYYPNLKYIEAKKTCNIENRVRLFYAGDISEEKGYPNVLNAAISLSKRNISRQVILNVVSNGRPAEIAHIPSNLKVSFHDWLPFEEFCSIAADNDIFLDLRINDFENTRCLPIKLFYYIAMQRPVIYTNLNSISEHYPEITECGHLVKPDDCEAIVSIIEEYANFPEKYRKHACKSRKLAEEKYNWDAIKGNFIKFVESLWA